MIASPYPDGGAPCDPAPPAGDRAAGRAEGDRRKRAALDLHAAHRSALVLSAQRALLRHALDRGSATADDVRAAVELPPGCSPKAFGAAPGPLARAGIIERVGYAETCRPIAHARPTSVWRIRDRYRAERWLVEHPDRQPEAPAPINGTAGENKEGPVAATAEPSI